MSTDDRTASRAEARRRARLAARGELPEPVEREAEPEPREARGSLLSRVFPPAPPLPNRPDPLAGYEGGGALRPVTAALYLLRRNPVAWILPGLAAFPGYILSFGDRTGILSLVGTFLLFGALIASGWFGWQRPPLFGVATAFVCFVISVGFVLFSFAQRGAGPDTFGSVVLGQVVSGLYLAALGFIGGWYGGYLRRRQTQLSGLQRPRSRRR